MTVIDDKVVAMSFETSKFESGVGKTISALDKLKASLHFPHAGKGLEEIDKAAKRVDLSHIAKGLDDIKHKFDAMHVAALAIFASIAHKAVTAGLNFAKAFTIAPITAGFREYATNLNSIQTILANTQASGAGLEEVNATLDELNEFSDKTIYNFSQMARNIGTFTAAGVALKPATAAIKGIANLAALSGSNAEQASTAMYQLSQAIAAGRVGLQDWNSVVNAGMGGTVFQRALAQTAVAMGTLKENSLKLVGPMKNVSINGESFRQSMQAGPGKTSWLSSEVLTKTLSQFTGDLKDSELAAQGFTKSQIAAIQQTAKTAQLAATEVKTITQAFDVAKETAGSGWAKTFQLILGDFGEAKTTFTALSETINGFINTNADARNKVLGDWKALGGRTILINTIKTAFQNLMLVLSPIKKAFRDIFPAKTGRDLYDLTVRFKFFVDTLKPSPTTIENLRRTFRGLFAIFSIGTQVIKGIFTVFRKLFGEVGDGSGGFLEFTGNIGDWLVALDEALKKGTKLNKFFETLGDILSIPIKLIGDLASALANLFSGFSPGGFSGEVDGMTEALTPFQKVLEAIANAWSKFMDSIDKTNIFQAILDGLVKFAQEIGPAIGKGIANINWDQVLAVINTGLFAGLVYMFKGFFGRGSFLNQITKGFGAGILGNISGSFRALEGSMKAMQTNLKAKTLKEIAIAILLLTASVVALSFVSPENLKKAIVAMGFMFAELLGAMAILDKIGASKGFLKMPFISASLIALAVAIDLLTIAVFTLSKLSWDELLKGLSAVAVLLGTVVAASVLLSKYAHSLVFAGAGLILMAGAIDILSIAVQVLGSMDQNELARGLGAVAVLLGTVVAASVLLSKYSHSLVFASVGITAIAVALNILSGAVLLLGHMDPVNLAKGLGAVAFSLGAIVAAMGLMSKIKNIFKTAAALLVVATALNTIALAVKIMGGMSVEQIAKGLGTLAGALTILTIALKFMGANIRGALSLGIVAAGIALLAPALVLLGRQSVGQIIKSLVVLAGALTILGVAGALISPVIPSLLGLGAALILIGAGLALAGAGIALIGIGLAAIAVAGPTAIAILVAALDAFVTGVIDMAKDVILGLLEIVEALAATAPKFVKALVKIIAALLDAIIKSAPKIAEAFTALLDAALKVVYDNDDKLIKAGLDLIISLLKGISDSIGDILTAAGDVIVGFVNGLAKQSRRVVDAGVDFITSLIDGIAEGSLDLIEAAAKALLKFLKGLAAAIRKYEPQIIAAGFDIGAALVEGMIKGLGDVKLVKKLKEKAKDLAKLIPDTVMKVLEVLSPSLVMQDIGEKVVEGLTKGIVDNKDDPPKAIADVAKEVIQSAKEAFEVLEGLGRKSIHDFASGVRGAPSDINNAFRTLNEELRETISTTRKTIETEQARLKELMKKPLVNADNIKAAQKAIAANQAVLAESLIAQHTLNVELKEERAELVALTRAYGDISNKLEAARQILAEAKKTRDDAIKSFTEQYSQLPSIATVDEDGKKIDDQVQAYKDALAQQVRAVAAYKKTLTQLRKLGLDDKTYKRLLEEGTGAQEFADQLLMGGKKSVQELNKLDTKLDKTSAGFATIAAKNLYQAGVDAAQGLVDGLKSRKTELGKVLEDIAMSMVVAVKKSLKIKSPSGVFAELGKYVSMGMAKGLIESSKMVTNAVDTVTDDAIGAMRNSLSKISDIVLNEINPNPTITPILDLTHIHNQAKALDSILNTTPIRASASLLQASAIASRQTVSQTTNEPATPPEGAVVKFEQNNYSPEALDPVEIYRQTRNQLGQLRSVVVPG